MGACSRLQQNKQQKEGEGQTILITMRALSSGKTEVEFGTDSLANHSLSVSQIYIVCS